MPQILIDHIHDDDLRVINGFPTNGPLPYQLQHRGCGAILISKNYAITAEHCLDRKASFPMLEGDEIVSGSNCKEDNDPYQSIMTFHRIDAQRCQVLLSAEN